MYVSIAIARTLLGQLEHQGVNPESVCEAARVPLERLSDPGGELPVEEYRRVVEAAIAASGDPSLGLRAGLNAPTGAAHVLGFVLVNSRTLRDAIRNFVRYGSLLIEGATWSFTEADDTARFGYTHDEVSGSVARLEAEMVMSFGLSRIGLHFLGPGTQLREARFCHDAPPWVEMYERTFRCPLRFGAPVNELVFDRAYLDVPQLHSDDWVCQLLRERAGALLQERNSIERLPARVKDLLKCRLAQSQPDAESVARELGLSSRTLRRRLGDLGCSLRELFDEARKELACAALSAPEPSIKEVAYALGFSEPSAFHRAFKRWVGMTPQQYRDRIVVDRSPRKAGLLAPLAAAVAG